MSKCSSTANPKRNTQIAAQYDPEHRVCATVILCLWPAFRFRLRLPFPIQSIPQISETLQKMGKVLSAFRAPRHAYVQRQAEKVISQDKPTMHPLYPTEAKVLDRIRLEHPELDEKVIERRRQLEENVNKLRIMSQPVLSQNSNGDIPGQESRKQKAALPRQRLGNEDTRFGFYESTPDTSVPPGKILFRDVMTMLSEVNSDRTNESTLPSSQLAADFRIDEADVQAIRSYFAPFERSVRYDYERPTDRQNTEMKEKWETQEVVDQIHPELNVQLKELSEISQKGLKKRYAEFDERKKAQEESEQKMLEKKQSR